MNTCFPVAMGLLALSGCSSSEPAPLGMLSVRYAGGETTDFGNGDSDFCATSRRRVPIGEEEALGFGIDIEAERAWLGEPHRAALRWTSADCAEAPEDCAETEVELRAEIESYVRIDGFSQRVDPMCEPEWQALAYRAKIGLRTDDGLASGAFYAVLARGIDERGEPYLRANARPDLRNFQGTLPLRIGLGRPHYAYLQVTLELGPGGATLGRLQPSVAYYDDQDRHEDVGAEGVWDSQGLPETYAPLPSTGQFVTLSSYRGSQREPVVALGARADAVEPAAPVEVTIVVDGEVVEQGMAEPGTSFELGEHPFGVDVRMEVKNPNGAGLVRGHILQDNCFAASSSCEEANCTARTEYTSGFLPCF